ncbi:hypothetical protein [Nostoc sp. LPT]|uniref:hypothetical protein n=1 Tax=Nostoc sp. LPT TaxID=2815387 RepID=UPI0025DF7724|nr:hypothetical protein [Nostoc sp. LPT]
MLTKSDRVDFPTQVRVQDWLKQNLSPGVNVIPCQDGKISGDLLLGFNAAVEDNLDSRPSHQDNEAEHEHDQGINAVRDIQNPKLSARDWDRPQYLAHSLCREVLALDK